MLKRISRLRNAKINSVGIASVFQAGDTNEINMRIKVLADQRSLAVYRDAVTGKGRPKRIPP